MNPISTDLERELRTALQHRAEAVGEPHGVLAAARSRHRRRTVRRRTAAAGGTLGLGAALAATALAGGPPAPAGPAPAPATAAPVRLDAATVSARVAATLDRDAESPELIRQVRTRITVNGRSVTRGELTDNRGRAIVYSGPRSPGMPDEETGYTERDGTAVTTVVNHDARTWYRTTHPADPTGWERMGDPQLAPDAIRASLTADDGTWTLTGEGTIGGRRTIGLEWSAAAENSIGYDLWVDAETYRLVRRIIVKPSDGSGLKAEEDYTWLPRTAENLAKLRVTVPDGYQRETQPPAQG